VSYHDDIDRFLGSIGDRAVVLDRDPPPHWVDVTAKLVLDNVVVMVVPDHEAERPGRWGRSLAYTLTRLGAASRRAACEAFGEPQADAAVTRMVESATESDRVGDWWGAVCLAARVLMEVGDGARSVPEVQGALSVPEVQVLTPLGLRRELRDRLGYLLVESVLYDEGGELRDAGTLSTDSLNRCWYFGFCLSACRASLPDDAARELSAFTP
jgi:hypothetical protein